MAPVVDNRHIELWLECYKMYLEKATLLDNESAEAFADKVLEDLRRKEIELGQFAMQNPPLKKWWKLGK